MHRGRLFQILSVTLIVSFLLAGPAQAARLAAPAQADALVQGGALEWNTFLGDSSSALESADAIAVDADGNVYIAGTATDAFVAKLDSSGTLIWSTSQVPNAPLAIALDGAGNVYVAGQCSGTWGDPVDPCASGSNVFVAKLDNGGALVWNTCLGGSGGALSFRESIAVDSGGNVRVTGSSGASWGDPVNPFSGPGNLFVAALDADGMLAWNTFLDGNYQEYYAGIALDASGNAYVTGRDDITAFVAKLDSGGALTWSTLLDDSTSSSGQDIAIDEAGSIYVGGIGTGEDSQSDALIAKLDSSGTLVWQTLLGGDSVDEAYNIVLDASGNAYVTGGSQATWGTPVRPFASGRDGFVAKLNSSGMLVWNTFLGGADEDWAGGSAVDGRGNIYTAGASVSAWGSPVHPFAGGDSDAFVAKLRASGPLYVKASAAGSADGTSWTNAYTSLQSALAVATSGDQIWVAAGTYLPTADEDRTVSFALKDGVAIYGGFSGAAGTEGDFSQRDPTTNVTTLSGNIGASDNASDNSYHVVAGSGVSNRAVLDGFTITAGNADAAYSDPDGYYNGGGMYIEGISHITLSAVAFSNNTASFQGGGLADYGSAGSSVELTNVAFTGNTAMVGGGMVGGLSNTLTDVTFDGNSARAGGGMATGMGSHQLTNVTFSDNTATGTGAHDGGGGMYNSGSSPTLINVAFSGNSAANYGGGMFNEPGILGNGSNPALTDVTFSGNTAAWGGGMYNNSGNPTLSNVTFSGNSATTSGGGMYSYESSPTLTNVAFTNNTASLDGGGISNHSSSNAQLTNVTFSGNTATVIGGGIDNDNSNPVLTNVTFSGNTAQAGGGMYNFNSSPQLANMTFSGNTASGAGPYDGGGGMYNEGGGGTPTLNNVTFSGNTSTHGGAMRNYDVSPSISNSLFWGNGPIEIDYYDKSAPTITDSIVAGGCPAGATCTNVLNADPKLAPLANNGGFTQTRALLPGSAAIDKGGMHAACAATDQRGITRPQGAACDMGAYELTFLTISGNAGAAGTTLSYAGGATSANLKGMYSFKVPYGWSGTVTPSKAGYVFTPAARAYASVRQDQGNQNYSAHRLLAVSVRSGAAQDGWVLESGEKSNTGGSINVVNPTLVVGDNSSRKQYRAILSFSTGGMPDNATIVSATLMLTRQSILPAGSNPFNVLQGLMIDMRKGYFGTSAALQVADFQAAANRTIGPFKPAPAGALYSIKLPSAALASINKLATGNGLTQLRLRFKLDDNNNSVANTISFFSGNYASAGYQPRLVIQYYVP